MAGRLTNLCERLVVSPGISSHQESGLPEGCLDLVSAGSRSEGWAPGVAPGAAANFSTARWLAFLDDLTGISGFSKATSHELPAEASPVYDADTITLPVVDGLFHLEVKAGATGWVSAARSLRTPSSSIRRTSRAPDLVQVSL
uniref:Uncharacterized protein n=1 Tax=Molossus molossus TaxID=27622 RepID=A0A7J8ER33_MOLMO|nr:hypothetical protein HJG59_008666 [Molossus molossus]